MKKNSLFKIAFLSIAIIVAISLFSVRNSVIDSFDWKQTSGGNYCPDFINFIEGTNYKYQSPLLKENEEVIGVAIFQLNGRLVIFSIEDKSFVFFMKV